MSEVVHDMISHSIDQWQNVRRMMETAGTVSGCDVTAQVEDAANQCLAVAMGMTATQPDRALTRELQQTLVDVAREASDEGARERILAPQEQVLAPQERVLASRG